jgi:catechol-2,3-dioxygenase
MAFLLKSRRFFSTGARIRNIILLVKDPSVSAKFYQTAIGVDIHATTENMVQLDAGGTAIILKVEYKVAIN